jgi:hypothetical protein
MVKGSNFSTSTGDEAGSLGGVVSGLTKGKAEFILYSFDVKFDGKNVARMADLMIQNKGSAANTPPFPEVQPPNPVIPAFVPDDQEDDDEITAIDIVE